MVAANDVRGTEWRVATTVTPSRWRRSSRLGRRAEAMGRSRGRSRAVPASHQSWAAIHAQDRHPFHVARLEALVGRLRLVTTGFFGHRMDLFDVAGYRDLDNVRWLQRRGTSATSPRRSAVSLNRMIQACSSFLRCSGATAPCTRSKDSSNESCVVASTRASDDACFVSGSDAAGRLITDTSAMTAMERRMTGMIRRK